MVIKAFDGIINLDPLLNSLTGIARFYRAVENMTGRLDKGT